MNMENPKTFISYCWSSPVHEHWVLNLAIELRESGVDVILDKWDLKEGHDSLVFMEKMVNDPDIKKVVIVSDKEYATKADGRAGGVGTETQIISKEIYDNQEQDKFVAVVVEKDKSGNPYLPTYYKSRVYIDFSEPEDYSESFDTLLRWIYNKPLVVKPELGNRPAFLDDSEGLSLGTTSVMRRALTAVRENRKSSPGTIEEYLSTFAENLERFRIGDVEGEFDDAVLANIEKLIPYRNEAINLFVAIAQYAPEEENITKLHRFFESLIPYLDNPPNVSYFKESDFDNFRFIVHELFLYAVSVLIKYERFDQANYLLQTKYYLKSPLYHHQQSVMVGYGVLSRSTASLDQRNTRLNLRRLSLRADLLESRSNSTGIDFKYILQGDFVLFMRSEIDKHDSYIHWFPITLVYLSRINRTFEIFARSISKGYFDRVKCLLNINKPDDLKELLESYSNNPGLLPRWQFHSIIPELLLGYNQLATSA